MNKLRSHLKSIVFNSQVYRKRKVYNPGVRNLSLRMRKKLDGIRESNLSMG